MGGEQIRGDRAGAMADAFGQLRALEQQVLWLTAVEGMNAGDASERLALDPADLGQTAFHARDRLRVRYAAAVCSLAAPACRSIADRLPAFALGSAPKDLEASIRRHLAHCVACADALDDLNDLPQALRRANLAPPSGLPRIPRPCVTAEAPPARRRRGARVLGAAVLLLGLSGVAGALHASASGSANRVAISDGFLAPTPLTATVNPATLRRPPLPASIDSDVVHGGDTGPQVLGVVVEAPSAPAAVAPAPAAVAPTPPVTAPVPEGAPPAPEPEPVFPAVVEPVAEVAGGLVGGVTGLLGGVVGGLLGG